MPRGLGLATATTSAAFFPHLEQRIRELTRSSKSSERVARLRSTLIRHSTWRGAGTGTRESGHPE